MGARIVSEALMARRTSCLWLADGFADCTRDVAAMKKGRSIV